MDFKELFMQKPLIGMVHLPALPGSPNNTQAFESIVEYAVKEAKKLERAGLDGAIVENMGDTPLIKSGLPAYTIASMAVIVREIARSVGIKIGVNMLRNACVEALSVAYISGGSFIRCNVLTGAYATDQGIVEGCAAELLRLRKYLDAKVLVFGDVHVKHAHPIYNVEIEQAAADMVERGGADAVIVSGPRSPDPPPMERVQRVKAAVKKPVIIGSGLSLSNIVDYYKIADGLILGEKDFKEGEIWGGPSNEEAYRKAVSVCREIRASF